MELRDYLRVLRKRWMLIAILTLACVTGAAVVSILTTPTYEATTKVYVSVQNSGAAGELAQGSSFVQQQVKSYSEVITSERVLKPVISQIGLHETVEELALDVTASAPLDTVNIEISVTRPDPQQAADLANAITAEAREQIAEISRPSNGDESPITVSVLQSATVPIEPVAPNTRLNLVLGLLVGVLLGLLTAVLIEVLDTRIRSERDVKLLTDAPILGGIAFDKTAAKRPLIVQAEPNSPRAEAFRTLRTNLQFLDVEGGPRSFVVTSSLESEGKSTTAANLAIAVAQSNTRVLVIDADLRQPKLAEYMGLEGAVGLTDVLIGRARLEDVLQPWGTQNLVVLPAGAVPPNPSELLGSHAMAELLRQVERAFDMVIIDAPPLLPVTDGALLAKQSRGALLVVAAGRSRRAELDAAIATLQNVNARLSGIVLTMLPTRGPEAYGYGRYGYGHGRTYGAEGTASAEATSRA
ncbi:MAG: polysaccharide biosynthesis tyrosine autokinase [Microbacteriaceae bacterium]|nr:polysaccharide biosynthesis tyrosine autokinase [Microbacteriaceae bacterium]